MNLVVLGLEPAGLVAAACLADIGHAVTAVDRDGARIAALAAGEMPVVEPGLADLVTVGRRKGRLAFATDARPAVADAEAVFITVTAGLDEQGLADIAGEAAAAAPAASVLVLFGALVAGIGDRLEASLRARGITPLPEIVAMPSLQNAGSAVLDTLQADRIVIGTASSRARRVMGQIFRSLCNADIPLVYTTRRTAELAAAASNAYLAMKSSFVAEVAALCAASGASLTDIARIIDLDRRIGTGFLDVTEGDTADHARDVLVLAQATLRASGPVRPASFAVQASRRHSA